MLNKFTFWVTVYKTFFVEFQVLISICLHLINFVKFNTFLILWSVAPLLLQKVLQ